MSDLAAGTFELPGGHAEDGETPQEAAVREWQEEVGLELPPGEFVAEFDSLTGVYRHFVYEVDSEADIDLSARDQSMNPDGDTFEVAAWFDPSILPQMPDLRPELKSEVPRLQHALLAPVAKLSPRSGMVSLDLDPSALPFKVGADVGFPHVTVVYLGSDVDDDTFAQVCAVARAVATATPGPLVGTIGGRGTFPPSESSDWKTPVFAIPTVPGVESLRAPFERFNGSQHADYHPHVTMQYVGDGEEMPGPAPETPISFTHLSVHRGNDVVQFPFLGCEDAVAKAWADQPRHLTGQWGRPDEVEWAKHHRHTDTIIDYYTPIIQDAMARVFDPDVIDEALRTAYGSVAKAAQQNPSGRGSGLPPNQATAAAGTGTGLAVATGIGAAAEPAALGGLGATAAGSAAGTAALIAAAIAVLAVAKRRTARLEKALTDLYGDAYLQGAHSAAEASHGAMPSWVYSLNIPGGFWTHWTPGPGEDAASTAGGSLSAILRQRGQWIKEMTSTEVDRIGDVIRDAVTTGRPIEDARKFVNAVVHDEARAQLITDTEYVRASHLARMETYRLNGVKYVRWLAQPTACPECKENEAVSPLPLTSPWPSGNVPVHPHCRCVEAPYASTQGARAQES